jgi:hypothetical protein
MKALRTLAAVIVGYLGYAGGSMLLVGPVMAQPGTLGKVLGLAGLLFVGLVAGLLAAKIAGGGRRVAGFVLAGLVLLATLANLFMELGAEPRWYKLGTLVLVAPAILVVCLRPNR